MQTYKTHRNRYSLSHLSSETTATLPEYAAASTEAWPHPLPARGVQQPRAGKAFSGPEGWPSDRPPDYPDSADEADEETDSVAGDRVVYGGSTISLPPLLVPASHAQRRHFKRYSSSISPPGRYPNNYHQHYTHSYSHRNNRHHPHRSSYLHFQRFKSSAALSLPSPTDDPYLDSLLERSVHALEMSNTLLQSSISTQTSLSKLLKAPMVEASTIDTLSEEDGLDQLKEGTKGLTKRIYVGEERKGKWVDALEKIRNGVDRLLVEGEAKANRAREESGWEPTRHRVRNANGVKIDDENAAGQSAVSSSLPILSSMPGRRACKRRPSQLELQNSSKTCVPRLTYTPQNRSRLISPAPRAMTQYVVACSADAESITLPSTLGMRTQTVVKLPEPPTPAYNMLTSFVRRAPSSMPSSVSSSPSVPMLTSLMMRRRSNSVTSILSSGALARMTGRGSSIDDSCLLPPPSPELFRGRTPRPAASPAPHRPMTPPTEESTSSSSSSESLIAKQTVMSLRKILDQQAAKSDSTLNASSHRHTSRRAPAFLPMTPVPAPQVSTSNATASISRLFTKAIHTSSTRPPSPPRHSALKNGNGSRSSISAMQQADASASMPAAREPSDSGASTGQIYANGRMNPLLRINVAKAQLGMLPELVSAGVARAFGTVRANGASTPSSGQSTPKRISFAELPEGSRPEGQSSMFKDRQAQRRRRRLMNGRGRAGTVFYPEGENIESEGRGLGEAWEAGSPPIGGGWWPGWFGGGGGVGSALAGMGGSSGGMYVSRYEDRMEERLDRSWSGLGRLEAAPGFGGLDDWAV
ncbi:hypothetical protein APHAL10511_001560 [Amanita phalloides]|nr:hypothetical protein APHAL10511_001560 [Amanita phalloides]